MGEDACPVFGWSIVVIMHQWDVYAYVQNDPLNFTRPRCTAVWPCATEGNRGQRSSPHWRLPGLRGNDHMQNLPLGLPCMREAATVRP